MALEVRGRSRVPARGAVGDREAPDSLSRTDVQERHREPWRGKGIDTAPKRQCPPTSARQTQAPPTWRGGPLHSEAPQPGAPAPAATDAENDALTYGAALTDGNALPEWLGFAAGTRAFSGTPGADDAPAALGVTVTATDAGSPALSGSTSFTLTVKGSPPTAEAGSDVEGKRGEEGVVLEGSGTPHADGSQSLTYQWSIDGASHGELAGLSGNLGGAGGAKATFTVPRRRDVTDAGALDDGNWIDFELPVTDGDGESASDAVRLTIRGSTWVAVQVSAADAEAEESSGSIDFAVTLDKAARDAVSVDWATADGTATAGTDYTAASGTLTFAAGVTSQTPFSGAGSRKSRPPPPDCKADTD
ncbi:MAG: putative Ig domain-containing protein [Acidobacteria bacterium]|nr:putative Ig domain-containing protein [Acidobacteriota bacterium]